MSGEHHRDRDEEGGLVVQVERPDLQGRHDEGDPAPEREQRELGVDQRQLVRVDVQEHHVGEEHAEGHRGQAQVEAAQAQGG